MSLQSLPSRNRGCCQGAQRLSVTDTHVWQHPKDCYQTSTKTFQVQNNWEEEAAIFREVPSKPLPQAKEDLRHPRTEALATGMQQAEPGWWVLVPAEGMVPTFRDRDGHAQRTGACLGTQLRHCALCLQEQRSVGEVPLQKPWSSSYWANCRTVGRARLSSRSQESMRIPCTKSQKCSPLFLSPETPVNKQKTSE